MESYIGESDYIILNIINYCRNYIPIIKQYQKEIWCDLHDYDGQNPYHEDFIKDADYIFMSSDALEDYKSVMEQMIKQGKKLVVCTHGRKGATAVTAEDIWYEVPIIDVYERKDTNGAGDNFFSGFLYGHSKGYSIEKCLQIASVTGGLCISSGELIHEELSEDRVLKDYEKYYK